MGSRSRKRRAALSHADPPNSNLAEGSPQEIPTSEERLHQVRAAAVSTQTTFAGPFPPPEMLQKYNEISPGFSECLIADWKEQARHRREIEGLVIRTRVKNERYGQFFAFFLAVVISAGSMILIYFDKQIAGLTGLIAMITSLVSVFIYGRRRQEKELAEKRKPLDS
jgi:uncharacterized membrane protein